MSNDQVLSTYDNAEHRFKTKEEYPNWWKIEQDLLIALHGIGFTETESLDKESLVEIILEQSKEIQLKENCLAGYEKTLNDNAKLIPTIKTLKHEIKVKKIAIRALNDHIIQYGDHQDHCAIYDAFDSGRILDRKECDCGWSIYSKEFQKIL